MVFANLFNLVSPLDIFSLVVFFFLWIGYSHFSQYRSNDNPSLMSVSNQIRFAWIRRIAERDVRVMDATLVTNLSSSPTFFASTTILIIGGLIATMGKVDGFLRFVDVLPFAEKASQQIWVIKTLLMVGIFVYSFFRFTWSLRLYNLVAVFIGASQLSETYNEIAFRNREEIDVELGCKLLSYAAKSFNDGLRGYYFSIAALSWFIHPVSFIFSTTIVVTILYHREFHSKPVQAILSHTNMELARMERKRKEAWRRIVGP